MVPLWAISNKGDVLCRLGVTSLTPAVSCVYCKPDIPNLKTCRPLLIQCWTVSSCHCCYWWKLFQRLFRFRVLPGSTWGQTNHSSQSLWGLPARFGPSPETVLPFTGVLSPHRAQQVGGSETAIENVYKSNQLYFLFCPSAGDSWYHIPSPSRQKLKQVSVGRTSVHAVDENGKLTALLYYLC